MGNTLRIGMFSKLLPSDAPNGVSVQVHRLAQEMSRRGHAVTCFTFSAKDTLMKYSVVTLPVHAQSKPLRKFEPARLFAQVDTRGFDILHYHGDDYLCKGDTRRIRTFYGSAGAEALHARKPSRFLYQALFYVFELMSSIRKGHLVGISLQTRAFIPNITQIIPCGVDTERFAPKESSLVSPTILFIGDFSSRKRGDLLVKEFTERVLPNCAGAFLKIVGPVPCSGPHIDYCGQPDESTLIELIRSSACVCIPSSWEGFGVPALEAMACKTPVVAVQGGALKEFVVSGQNGILCTEGDLGNALVNLLENAALREKLRAAGFATAQRFSMKNIGDQYEELYQKCR